MGKEMNGEQGTCFHGSQRSKEFQEGKVNQQIFLREQRLPKH